ncbi:MAG: ABC transporter permease [Solirubrobacteraceae bacterium]|nr:ABC transporter permease [Solirubrobacteraceae bacterium]
MSAFPARIRRSFQSPQVVGDDLQRFWNLTLTLAVTEFRVKYFGSVLGYLWSLMRPLMLFGVLYFVFTEVADLGADVKFYGVYLLESIVLWTFFAETTNGALTCLVGREDLLRKMRFPRLAVPLSVALTALFNLGVNFFAVFVFAIASGVTPHWGWLLVPFLIIGLAILATGLGMLLAPLYVRYRDMQPIWEVLMQIGFYASPILYVAITWPDGVRAALQANPVAAVLTEMRYLFLDPSAPTTADILGAEWRLIVPIAVTIGAFVLGAWYFQREAPRIAEDL